ncbi:MAG: hypothetical protein J7M14_05190 [Planctomycetes bacterium]|nr:hypothetical protein [Planctomycetota bacterium]
MRRGILSPALLLLISLTARGSWGAFKVVGVIVHVQPIIHITQSEVTVARESSRVGPIVISSSFYIDANAPSLHMYVEATDLYMDGNTRNPSVPPIPLDVDSSVEIAPADAAPADGSSNVARFVENSRLGEFAAKRSEIINFVSNQATNSRTSVPVTVTWNQNDPTKPAGRYIGKVKLAAVHMP